MAALAQTGCLVTRAAAAGGCRGATCTSSSSRSPWSARPPGWRWPPAVARYGRWACTWRWARWSCWAWRACGSTPGGSTGAGVAVRVAGRARQRRRDRLRAVPARVPRRGGAVAAGPLRRPGAGRPTDLRDTLAMRLPALQPLRRMSFRLHATGFLVWTFAVMAGAVWAEASWGRYWGWDPKETWAFISWVVYAAYLHAQATASVRATTGAWLAVAGWATMVFNLFAVNLVISGLHSTRERDGCRAQQALRRAACQSGESRDPPCRTCETERPCGAGKAGHGGGTLGCEALRDRSGSLVGRGRHSEHPCEQLRRTGPAVPVALKWRVVPSARSTVTVTRPSVASLRAKLTSSALMLSVGSRSARQMKTPAAAAPPAPATTSATAATSSPRPTRSFTAWVTPLATAARPSPSNTDPAEKRSSRRHRDALG
ncbi:cytochrome c biogenesis protein CcsA [Micromonospora sp. M12]